jgi:hypothetical protein
MNYLIFKNLVSPVFPKIVRPHEATLSELNNPDVRVLCGAYTIYDVWY